ncbi:SDR family NAD(P)-dependent oxidoreductase [Acetobacter sp. AN02]|uniref:SDR family NAD(P)-dependent oxidoreductase n=1 Tax=Acetobacter sp. AN02 TaxID=2894186 RepID=UPI0024345087|nr:SDR family NAD(P)-dependent oxidoreductase [Acetobacter sp. AN02]MDG6093832.1 SDR family NAD(P)-dependent oxidoreductase [Acetobacter sp. AN02]
MKHSAKPAPRPFRTILITGASGGIGSELAKYYAAPGKTLILWGRNSERLEEAAAPCRAAGAEVIVRSLDLADPRAAIAALREDDEAHPIDLMICNAGRSDIRRSGDIVEPAESVMALGLINYTTPASMTMAAAERMQKRGGGSIVLIGSAAGFHDLPFAAGYCGSKGGLFRFSQAARLGLEPVNVRLTYVAPGFVDTDMCRRLTGPYPWLVSVQEAVRNITQAARNGEAECIFPKQFRFLRLLPGLLPRRLQDLIMKRIESDQKPRSDEM